MSYDDINNAYKSGRHNLIDWFTFGRVGNSESGEAYKKVQDVPEAMQVDDTGTYVYIGTAIPGTSTSSGDWRIKRITSATGTTVWADGDALYDNVWDDRATLSYS